MSQLIMLSYIYLQLIIIQRDMQNQIYQVFHQANIALPNNTRIDLNSIITQFLRSLNIESSYYLHQILKIVMKYLINTRQIMSICNNINNQIKKVNNIAMFLIIYEFNQLLGHPNKIDWNYLYKMKANELIIQYFNEWAINHQGPERKQLLYLIITMLPIFFKQRMIEPTVRQFHALLFWIALFQVEELDEHLKVCEAIKLLKEVRINTLHDYEQKEHLMLKRVLQILGKENTSKGSLYLLFDSISIRQKDIEYFCHIYQSFIEDLDENHLCNVFSALSRNGINRQILSLIKKVSHIIKHHEEYFTLRFLYQQFILPIFTNKFKAHKKFYEEIYTITRFYVVGFMAHCSLDLNGIDCLLNNIEHVEQEYMRSKWAQLALLACKDNEVFKEIVRNKAAKLGLPKINIPFLPKNTEIEKPIWVVNLRNGRKLKKYPQISSMRFKGINNRLNQCYIISSIQSLFLTEELFLLLSKHKKTLKRQNLHLSLSFLTMFQGLNEKRDKLTVQDIKYEGPQVFKISKNQEDAQEYLLALFQTFQYELKSIPEGLKDFLSLFKIQYTNSIICKQCKQSTPKQKEHTFIHGYRTNEHFRFQWQDFLQGYRCPKCHKLQCYMKRTISNRPKILILHITRFEKKHTKHGIIQKILGNKPIKRQIQNYRLAGFISHKGNKISSGHYLFYGKIGKDRWAIFNDNAVNEIVVGQEQQFQRQFREENTPYILFYRYVG